MTRFLNLFFVATNVIFTRLHLWWSGLKRETHIYAVRRGRPLKLDIYRPKTHGRLAPVIVYAHGGGWRLGSRRLLEPAFMEQVKRGYALVSVQYSFTNRERWPAQIHELKSALRWVRANAAMFEFDPNMIIAAGASAGGHLACVAGLSGPGVLEGELGETQASSAVNAIAVFYPPTDLAAMFDQGTLARRTIHELIGGTASEKADALNTATPMTHVRSDAPPLYVMHGDADHVVPYPHATTLVETIRSQNGSAELITLERAVHSDWRFKSKENRATLDAFLDRISSQREINAATSRNEQAEQRAHGADNAADADATTSAKPNRM